MHATNYSRYSFNCSIIALAILSFALLWLAITPSPALAEAFGDNLIYPIGVICIVGLVFSAIGIREPNNWKKWIGIVVNIFFAFLFGLFIFG